MQNRFRTKAGFARTTAIAVLFAWLAPSAVALAAEGEVERTLAIVELRTGNEASPLTTDYLKEVGQAFRDENSGDYILVAPEKGAEKLRKDRDQVPTALTEERRAALTEARKKGIEYLDNADAANAIKALQAAEAKYRAAIAAPGADDAIRKEYLDVLAQLATAYVISKDKDAASEVFRTVITAFGLKAQVTDDNYRPDVVELFKAVVKEVNALKKGSLEVTSTTPGAHIILSGIDRGATPFTVADLIPGTYAVRLQQEKTTSLLHRVKIAGGGASKLNVDVEFETHLVIDDKQVGLSYSDFDAAGKRLQNDAVALGRELEVNMVCVVGVMDGKLQALLIDVAGNKITRSSSNKVPQVGISKRAVASVVKTILGESKKPEEVVIGEKPAPAPAGGWYTSVPGWIAGGLGLGGLGLGAANAGNLSSAAVEVTSDEEAQKIQTGRTLAGVGFGLGAALIGVSVYFFYAKAKSSAAPDAPAATWLLPNGSNLGLPPVQLGNAPVHFVMPAQSSALPAQ